MFRSAWAELAVKNTENTQNLLIYTKEKDATTTIIS